MTLGYNPADQIATRTSANDAYAWTGAVNLDRNYAANGLNQYMASGNVTPTYDARGNLTSAGGASYLYNSKNQLSGANGTFLYYDAVGRLDYIPQADVLWEWDGSRLVTERSGVGGTTIVRRYVHGPGADEPIVQYDGAGTGQRRWLDADERGSIVRVTNDAGGVVAINSYDEYGIPGTANYGRFQYTGQMWMPELGFYHYKARMYSPTLGRFLQTDPIGYGDGINWYDYVGGDPVNATDPTGTRYQVNFGGSGSCTFDFYDGQVRNMQCSGGVSATGAAAAIGSYIASHGLPITVVGRREPRQTVGYQSSSPAQTNEVGSMQAGGQSLRRQCQRMDARAARGRAFGGALSEWAGNASNALAVAAAIPTPATPALAELALLGKGLSLAGTGIQLAADYGHARRTGDYARLKADVAASFSVPCRRENLRAVRQDWVLGCSDDLII